MNLGKIKPTWKIIGILMKKKNLLPPIRLPFRCGDVENPYGPCGSKDCGDCGDLNQHTQSKEEEYDYQ